MIQEKVAEQRKGHFLADAIFRGLLALVWNWKLLVGATFLHYSAAAHLAGEELQIEHIS